MTVAEAERLLTDADGERLCITYSRGPNGEIVTTDRPARFSFGRIAAASTAAAAAALTLSLSTPAAAYARGDAGYQGAQRPAASGAPHGGLRGTVRVLFVDDPADGVTITAREQNTRREFTTKSAADGTYELLLPKGRYDISMSQAGFETCQVDGVDIGSKVLVADAKLWFPVIGVVVAAEESVGECHNKKLNRIAHKK
jgi:hypothetical protein